MRKLSRYRPSPAMIVAIIALVVATTGGAIAGSALITGKNIKNGSVTGLDIKNNTIASADITNNSVASADVRNGTIGTIDLSAAATASLKSHESAAYHSDSGALTLGWINTTQVVATILLPAGNYVVFGKVQANNEEPVPVSPNPSFTRQVSCSMLLGNATIDSTFTRGLAEGDRENFSLSGRGNLAAPGAATITCDSGPNGSFVDRHIEAIQVGSLP